MSGAPAPPLQSPRDSLGPGPASENRCSALRSLRRRAISILARAADDRRLLRSSPRRSARILPSPAERQARYAHRTAAAQEDRTVASRAGVPSIVRRCHTQVRSGRAAESPLPPPVSDAESEKHGSARPIRLRAPRTGQTLGRPRARGRTVPTRVRLSGSCRWSRLRFRRPAAYFGRDGRVQQNNFFGVQKSFWVQNRHNALLKHCQAAIPGALFVAECLRRSEEHTSELQSRLHLVCRLLLEKKKT